MSIVPGLKITTLMASAANGDTYGDAERRVFRGLQTLLMPNIISFFGNTPPVGPTNSQTYVVGSAPSGVWTGQANNIAYWAVDAQDGVATTGVWEFYVPQIGWSVFNQADGFEYFWNGAWVRAQAGTANQIAVANTGIFSLPASVVFPAAFSPQKTLQAAATTTTIDPTLGNSFRVAVGTAVTSIVFNAGVADGQEITVVWVQDGGGHSVTGFASNIHGATTPDATPSAVSAQRFTWDSTLTIWYAVAAGVVGM